MSLGIHSRIPESSTPLAPAKPRSRRGLTIAKKMKDGILTVELRGHFDLQSYDIFQELISSFLKAKPAEAAALRGVVVHMHDLDSIDSAAIGLLILLKRKLLEWNGARLWICNIPTAIYEIFELTKLHRVFSIIRGREEFVESLPLPVPS